MSLQVNDPRSRTRSKSPGRERSRSRSRDSRVPSPRSRSPAVPAPVPSRYSPDEEAEIERQYKAISDRRNEPQTISRAPRDPRYVNRSGSDEDKRRKDDRSREDRYEHSGDERPRREYIPSSSASTRPRRRSSDRGSRDDSDSSVDDELAYGDAPGAHPSYARPVKYDYAQPHIAHAQPSRPAQPYPGAGTDWAAVPECERPGFVPPSSQADTASMPGAFPPAGFEPPVSAPYTGAQPYASGAGYTPSHYRTASAADSGYPPAASGYANPGVFQYAQVDPNVKYTSKGASKPAYTASAHEQFSRTHPSAHSQAQPQPQAQVQPQVQYRQPSPQPQSQPQPQQPQEPYRYKYEPQFVEIAPGGSRSGARPHSRAGSSSNLSVGGPSVSHAGHPPASPLLEPYRGTYQSISPMPSPIAAPSIRDEDISDLEPLDGGTSTSDSGRRRRHRSHSSVGEKDRHRSSKDKKDKERGSGDDKRRPTHTRLDSSSSVADSMVLISPSRRRVSFYDAAADAAAMQSALNHARNIDSKPIIQILPRLTSDEILTLRQEYKARVRLQGKGINLAKHLRLKLGSSNFAKVCYATALGRWESEAYWANCYYQAGTSRRELLIESLMGRSNAAIREIKNSFRDTRYENSLERCMRAELRADKFRTAILLALEGHRQDDREPLDKRLIRDDVRDLHHSLTRGGETAMIEIIVLRSDEHLREVLRTYEDMYRHNFAKAMIQKSQNLVGETLAHILNGAINRPMRDALLLHQALRESRSGRERSELLISRLVRLHWEPRHLAQVKTEYRRRYHERLEEAIAEEILALNGGQDWGEFCIELARSA